jgi:CHAT domain-containing protein/tetratricopeptide (TPR) repeat protein
MPKQLFLLCSCLLWVMVVSAQCPDRDSLWQKISFLKDVSPEPVQEIKNKLLTYERVISYCPYKNDSTHVLLLRAIAYKYYQQGDYLEAVKYLHKAIAILNNKANQRSVNQVELVGVYYWLFFLHKSLNNVGESLKALDSCTNIGERLHFVDRSLLMAFFERAEYFFDVGDYLHSIDYTKACERKALEYAGKVGREEKPTAMKYALSSFAWQVNSLIRLKRYDEAETLMSQRLSTTDLSNLADYRGTIYGLRAEMEVYKGNFGKATTLFKQALVFERKERRALGCKQLLNTMAYEVYYHHAKDYDKSLRLLQEALGYVNKDAVLFKADSLESLNILTNMAAVYVQQGQFEQAFNAFSKAWSYIMPGVREKDIMASPLEDIVAQKKIHYLTGLLTGEGDAYRKRYMVSHNTDDLQKAIGAYKKADRLVNRIKEEQPNLNSKLFWRSNSHALYEHALEASYTLGNREDAFYFFEKSRAVLLNDQLAEQRWLGEGDIFLLTQSRKRIKVLDRELTDISVPEVQRSALQDELLKEQTKLNALAATIHERTPFYYQNFIEHDFVTLDQVQRKVLKEYKALVEVFSGDSAVYLMVITAGDVRLRIIDKKAFDSLAGKFTSYLADEEKQNNQWEAFQDVSYGLYQLLFDKDPLPTGRIIISPDGQYFPFEALLTSRSSPVYFLEAYAVSYTYSARYLLNDFAPATGKKAKSFMGIAPVYCAGGMPALIGSDESLQQLSGYFSGAKNFMGKDASKNTFLQQFGDYRIIQLYTHAAGNIAHGEPVIYFADSLLYLSDLVSDKRPATGLVVLSACETGQGEFYQGEGVFNFNRGFAALGIPAAITSLWAAQNKKTYELTTLFYQYLAKGLPADVALQKAKLAFMHLGPTANTMPYLWAVPVLTGKVTAVTQPAKAGWYLWILKGLGVVAVIAVLIMLARRRIFI